MRIAPTQASPGHATPFVHVAWTPSTIDDDKYRCQRYFQGVPYLDKKRDIGYGMEVGENIGVTVYRDADFDVAQVKLYIGADSSVSECRIFFTPSDLRELAQRLLDAAHDIEVNPSQRLQVAA